MTHASETVLWTIKIDGHVELIASVQLLCHLIAFV